MNVIVSLIVNVLVVGILLGVAEYLLRAFPPPEPFGKVARIVLVVLGALALIWLLLVIAGSLASGPFYIWRP